MDPWSMVFDFTLIPSRNQLEELRDNRAFDHWKILFQPEFAHGFLKWGARVGYTKSWKDLWINGLNEAFSHKENLKQIDWQSSAMRESQFQNSQRSALLKKFAGKIQSSFPVEAQVFLATESLILSLPHFIPIDFKPSKKQNKTGSKNLEPYNRSGYEPGQTKRYLDETLAKSIPAPWGPILTLSKKWSNLSFSERLSTPEVEIMARDLARLPLKWESSFLDELIETLRSPFPVKPPAKPWHGSEIILLQLGSALGTPKPKNPGKIPKNNQFLPDQGLDFNARIQIAEMAAGAGHEINNPLAILTGTIQKLQKEWNKPSESTPANPPGPALELMLRQVQRVRTQIEELMWFSRPPEPKPVATNLAELKRIWNESVAEGSTEIPLPIRKPKNGSLILDPIHFGRVARLVGEFLRQHILKTGENQPNFSLQKVGKKLVGVASGPFPNWTPSQILGLFTPFFCPKGFGRSSGLHLPAARALAEKSGWSLAFVQGSKGTPGSIVLEIPVLTTKKTKPVDKKGTQGPQKLFQENIRYRPVA